LIVFDVLQDWLRDQVTTAVFQVLDALQHPPDCASARKLVCVLNKACGFGCQVHHLVHCLTHAVALNRTLIVQVREPKSAMRGAAGRLNSMLL
jgi:hypothetical protein